MSYSIYHGHTFIAIPVNPSNPTRIMVSDRSVQPDISNFLKKFLVEIDKRTEDVVYTYCYYCQSTSCIHLPYFIKDKLLRYLTHYLKVQVDNYNVASDVDTTIDLPKRIKILSKFKPREGQEDYIKFLTSSPRSMRLLASDPGSGKTFTSIYSAIQLGKRTLIVTPANLVKQWRKRLLEYTTLRNKDIFIISGNDSVNYLCELTKNNEAKFPVVLCSIVTLYNYIIHHDKYYEGQLDCYSLFKQLRFGTKIMDEVHLNFFMNVLIDLNTNIPNNIYLTATPSRSNKMSKALFKTIYPPYIYYNYSSIANHILVREVSYDFKSTNTYVNYDYFIIDKIGYSQNRYEKYILRRKQLASLLYKYYLLKVIFKFWYSSSIRSKVPGKLLIYVNRVDTAEYIVKFLKSHDKFKKFKVSTYVSKDKEDVLHKCDIIVTTFGSTGVGKDLKDIRTIISLVSLRSEVMIKQVIGRIRKSKNIKTSYFVFMYNRDCHSHLLHYRLRRRFVKNLVRNIADVNIEHI